MTNHITHDDTHKTLLEPARQTRNECYPSTRNAYLLRLTSGASHSPSCRHHVLASTAILLAFRLCHVQHGPSAAQPRRANFGRWRPPKRPFCRSDTHPPPWRSADRRARISRWSDCGGRGDGASAGTSQTCHFAELSRDRGSASTPPPHRRDPCNALYKRYTGCFG